MDGHAALADLLAAFGFTAMEVSGVRTQAVRDKSGEASWIEFDTERGVRRFLLRDPLGA